MSTTKVRNFSLADAYARLNIPMNVTDRLPPNQPTSREIRPIAKAPDIYKMGSTEDEQIARILRAFAGLRNLPHNEWSTTKLILQVIHTIEYSPSEISEERKIQLLETIFLLVRPFSSFSLSVVLGTINDNGHELVRLIGLFRPSTQSALRSVLTENERGQFHIYQKWIEKRFVTAQFMTGTKSHGS